MFLGAHLATTETHKPVFSYNIVQVQNHLLCFSLLDMLRDIQPIVSPNHVTNQSAIWNLLWFTIQCPESQNICKRSLDTASFHWRRRELVKSMSIPRLAGIFNVNPKMRQAPERDASSTHSLCFGIPGQKWSICFFIVCE